MNIEVLRHLCISKDGKNVDRKVRGVGNEFRNSNGACMRVKS